MSRSPASHHIPLFVPGTPTEPANGTIGRDPATPVPPQNGTPGVAVGPAAIDPQAAWLQILNAIQQGMIPLAGPIAGLTAPGQVLALSSHSLSPNNEYPSTSINPLTQYQNTPIHHNLPTSVSSSSQLPSSSSSTSSNPLFLQGQSVRPTLSPNNLPIHAYPPPSFIVAPDPSSGLPRTIHASEPDRVPANFRTAQPAAVVNAPAVQPLEPHILPQTAHRVAANWQRTNHAAQSRNGQQRRYRGPARSLPSLSNTPRSSRTRAPLLPLSVSIDEEIWCEVYLYPESTVSIRLSAPLAGF